MKLNVLLLGSGGREHAFAWKIAQSPLLNRLFIAPGNAGTAGLGENVDLSVNDFPAIEQLIRAKAIQMLVVGPEEPLVNGIVDYFSTRPEFSQLMIIGPDQFAAQLEGSKDFAKAFLQRNNIPTAAYKSFTSSELKQAISFLEELQVPYVLKADGLAAGKGVVICQDLETAKSELSEMLGGKFGKAGDKVVIEEFLKGIEVSVFALSDGKNYCMLPFAKDYKKIGENDEGPNTGGMGSLSPVSFVDSAFEDKVMNRIVKPTFEGLAKEKIDYRGFLFFGLIKVGDEPFVIEYNCRMGDPETESVFARIESDFLEMLWAAGKQELDTYRLEISKQAAACVMLVSEGYPGEYQKGFEISGLPNVQESIVFHAGTKLKDGKVVTNGGRVMAITSLGGNLSEALKKSYSSANLLCYENIAYRKDIGFDLPETAKREKEIN
jgi:phosphoribosylamine---glycine ligase